MCCKLQIVVSHEEAPTFFLLTDKLPFIGDQKVSVHLLSVL